MFEDAAVAPDAARAWTQRQKRLQIGVVTNLQLHDNLDLKNDRLSNCVQCLRYLNVPNVAPSKAQ
jgi:hypothetical protein